MRALTSILTIYILLLTLSPSFLSFYSSVSETCTEESCCNEKECSDDTCPPNQDCGMGICNPFMVCCNCNAVVSQKQGISVPVSISNKKYFPVPAGNCCGYITEAWNPPKVV